jgi:DNA-binding IclR family transcriptional regulator
MRGSARRVRPDEYILAALSPEERLEAALRVAREAFKDATLTVEDVEAAVRRVRRRRYAPSARKTKRRS